MNNVYELLKQDGSIIANKNLVRAIGTLETILYCELLARYSYFEIRGTLLEDGSFWNTIEDIENGTGMGRRPQERIIKKLIELQLINCVVKGNPATRHFWIIQDDTIINNLLQIGKQKEIDFYKNKNTSYPKEKVTNQFVQFSQTIENTDIEQFGQTSQTSLDKTAKPVWIKPPTNNTNSNNTNFNNTNKEKERSEIAAPVISEAAEIKPLKTKKEKVYKKYTPEIIVLTQELIKGFNRRNPKQPTPQEGTALFNKWCEEIDKLHRIGVAGATTNNQQYSHDEILEKIDCLDNDSNKFWIKNCCSAETFRRQINKFHIGNSTSYKTKGTFSNAEERPPKTDKESEELEEKLLGWMGNPKKEE